MKYAAAITWVGLLLASGCTRWNILHGPEKSRAPGPGPSPAARSRSSHDNSGRIQTLRCTDLDMTCWSGLQSFGLRGKMIAQKPRNFLLGADLFGNREVDLGSNDKEFWYWIKKADPPYQFFWSYKNLAAGRANRIPFPFQPDWIIEALGMGTYGPAERYQVEVEGDKLKLVEKTVSPQGRPVRKVIVMNRLPVKSPHPQVTAFLLLDDASNEEICSAHITETQLDRNPQGRAGILPRRIEFRWSMPNQRLKLAMKLGDVTVNPPMAAATFARLRLQGVPSFDLATGQVDQPASVRQVQGQ